MRVYVPATAADLAPLSASEVNGNTFPVDLGGRSAHAVTRRLAAQTPDADVEELEWEAFLAAAIDSALLLITDPELSPMRVVLSVEVPDEAVSDGAAQGNSAPSSVQLTANAGAKLMAIHVDEPASAPVIQKLLGDPTAATALENVAECSLLWYDPSEAADIPIP